MRKLLILLATIVILATSGFSATNGVEFEISLFQIDSLAKRQLLMIDTFSVLESVEATGYFLVMSVDIGVQKIDSLQTEFVVHTITLGPTTTTDSRRFSVEYGAPARMDRIKGKNEIEYSLQLKPLQPVELDNTCEFDHNVDKTFSYDPSANMDIYYVPNSLGDFHWNIVKSLQEERYRQFKTLFNLNLPGKMDIFLCPCEMRSVLWDTRFGQMVNPTRNVGFAIYNQAVNAADPFIVIHGAILRTFGYSPPFLSEGLAGYISMAAYDMKQIFKKGAEVPFESYLNTKTYLQADPFISDRTASTFVTYLIDQYGWKKFHELYKIADDLSLSTSFRTVYKKGTNDLEAEWRRYIDTVTIPLSRMKTFYDQAEAMRDYPLMLEYAKGIQPYAKTLSDSLYFLKLVERAHFLNGDYYAATETEAQQLQLDSTDARKWMSSGSYKLMNGLYEDALKDLKKAEAIDDTDPFVLFNLAQYYLVIDDKETAKEILLRIVGNTTTGEAQAESRVLLGNLLRVSKNKQDRAMAITYYQEAISMFAQQLQAHAAASDSRMWMGISYLGMDDKGSARELLDAALFLETRPFYIGMTYLWLGKLADVNGDRTAAKSFYRTLLNYPAAVYHQKEAKTLLYAPYKQ